MKEHIERWNPQNEQFLSFHPVSSYYKWESNVDEMITFAEHRPYWVRNHIQDRFNAGEQNMLLLTVSDSTHGYIKLNSIDINSATDGIEASNPYPWSGIYFKNVPVILTAIPKAGYKFSHWSGEIEDTSSKIILNLERDMYVKANFVLDTQGEDSLIVVETQRNDIMIYPNPFIDKVNILADIYEGTFTVYSVDGKIISKGEFNSSEIDLSMVPKGILILELVSEKGVIRKQLIKQ